eukprot:630234-Alexandrium_andersonii.AAC.1
MRTRMRVAGSEWHAAHSAHIAYCTLRIALSSHSDMRNARSEGCGACSSVHSRGRSACCCWAAGVRCGLPPLAWAA